MIKQVLLLLFALNLALANLTYEAQAAYDAGDEQTASSAANDLPRRETKATGNRRKAAAKQPFIAPWLTACIP